MCRRPGRLAGLTDVNLMFSCPCPCSRALGSEQGGTNGTSGPIIRTMKSSRSGAGEVSDYKDAVALLDCTPFWRRLGFRSTCQRVWFVKDICGVICAMFTWGLILYAEYVVTLVVLLPSPDTLHSLVNGLIFQLFIFLAIASHLKTMLTDPVSEVTHAPFKKRKEIEEQISLSLSLSLNGQML